MARITFIEHNGKRIEVEAQSGDSLMKVALANGVEGLTAECGGCLSCATCHAYVDDDWVDRIPSPTDEELVMVECAVDARPNSRLTCQVVVSDDMDGLVVHLPASQY
ncbi:MULTISPECIES: 2Fe-2S iron-sulfur cluster-binding protein [unclassified Pseudomonas]|uniref:2Fe-2S iron-sulfur cluster-binding protein n=1 Tax=unclassified Pseudomonas TaxID=196821 RepID=UPI00177F70BB|nr:MULTISPECIES: 2Fe-2S iron-sulfur cluster-binding protein [unclassified Pseudomonas]MBD9562276.1 2Fe-2S iron-sulfur cluster binding domain-containing protein [Pseudomonas sp. PDM09]MBV7495056.1 2Fe-2S iron-sulfur cluster binding domain-containing protein [Pseudomonas sp. PDM24]